MRARRDQPGLPTGREGSPPSRRRSSAPRAPATHARHHHRRRDQLVISYCCSYLLISPPRTPRRHLFAALRSGRRWRRYRYGDGESWRVRISPADREGLRGWLRRFDGVRDPPAHIDVVREQFFGQRGAPSHRVQVAASGVLAAGVVHGVGERAALTELAFVPDLIDVAEVDADRLGQLPPRVRRISSMLALMPCTSSSLSARLIARAQMSSYSSFAVGSTPAGRSRRLTRP